MPLTNMLQKRTTQVVVALALVVLIGAFSFLRAGDRPHTVAQVNGVEISRDMFYDALERYMVNGDTLGSIALRQLISETLVTQANDKYDLGVDDAMVQAEYDRVAEAYGDQLPAALAQTGMTDERLRHEIRIGLILERLVTKDVTVTDEQIQTFYDEHKGTFFVQPELYRASQILVETEDEAREILDELAGGATFAELRSERSLDKGDWGALAKTDQIPQEIADALFSLEVGEVSEPVKTNSGFYLIRLEEIVPEHQYTLDEVREDIRRHLLFSQAPSVDEAVGMLWEEADLHVMWDQYKHLLPQGE